ncbi:coiled-coil domain-containing protein 22-like [Macrosteles quadrilineatus]|uniref:coiled-coil domain-containing protein 22-like n=1 Tax=Macrosteles quadrilineatus TaxID=74068 RepID=UPI0023E10C03|nr:coiled-coil domain-containing protein 22-like [Macrosteles quadrilineatus]
MEEVDKIILQSFKEIGCTFEEDVVSLRQFTAEMVVASAARCINVIQPGLDIPSKLPPSMSSRYKLGTVIAEACIELGYTGEIGYQTFLYASEADVRKVFMFLVEKLPKESDKTSSQPEESSSSLRQRFAIALRQQLTIPYCPSESTSASTSFVSVPLETGISLPGQKRDCTPQEWREYCVHRLPFLHEQVPHTSLLLPSIISHHAQTCLGLPVSSATPSTPLDAASSSSPPVNSWMQIASSLLYTKEPSKKWEKIPEKEDKEPEVEEQEKNDVNEQEELERLRERMDQLTVDIKTVTSKLTQVATERQKQEAVLSKRKREADLRQTTLDLLPDSAANTSKLQELVEEQARTLLRLGTQWEKHRAPLVARYREARERLSDKASESARQLETARQTRERLREMKEELTVKEALQARLQQDYDKLSNTQVTRTAYTRRILEIIGNIKKQREEIDKIVEDTKQLQRDINIVSDRVDRSFTYADELIFRDCKQDNASRKIYKLLMQLHSECRQVVEMIEETGATVREIRDLEEQIEVERAKDTASKLERISADLRQMKQESTALRAQLARAGSPS